MYLNINKDTSVAPSYSVNLKNFYFKERNVYQKSIRRSRLGYIRIQTVAAGTHEQAHARASKFHARRYKV